MARRVIDTDLPGFVAKLAEVLELQGIKLSPELRRAADADRRAYFKRLRWLASEEAKAERAKQLEYIEGMANHLSVPEVIEKLGGLGAVSGLFGVTTKTAVMNWRAWNAFPKRLHLQIDRICREKGIDFDPAQEPAKVKRKRKAA